MDLFEVKGLMKGEACTYEIQGRCGAPSFTLKDLSNVTKEIVTVHFLEWNADAYDDWRDIKFTLPYSKFQPW